LNLNRGALRLRNSALKFDSPCPALDPTNPLENDDSKIELPNADYSQKIYTPLVGEDGYDVRDGAREEYSCRVSPEIAGRAEIAGEPFSLFAYSGKIIC